MTHEEATTVRSVWDALARGDLDEALSGFTPDARWHGADGDGSPGACHGRDHIRQFLSAARTDGRWANLVELRDAGDQFVAVVETGASESHDGERRHGELITLEDGRISSIVVYAGTAEALKAASLEPRGRRARRDLRQLAPNRLAGQLGHPQGHVGGLVTAVLNLANRRLNRRVIDVLSPQPGEIVLDIGFGGGVGSAMALKAGAHVIAIDPSEQVVKAGRRRLGDRVDVRFGSASQPGVPSGTVDAALAVNSVYFWDDLDQGLTALARVLNDRGRIAIGVERTTLRRHAGERSHSPATPEELADRLMTLEYHDVTVVHSSGRRHAVVLARVNHGRR